MRLETAAVCAEAQRLGFLVLPNQIRHKNRKIKRLRDLYPEINVKLFKRGDIRSLMLKFGIENPDMLHNEL